MIEGHRNLAWIAGLLAAFAAAAGAQQTAAPPRTIPKSSTTTATRVRLRPKLFPGEAVRYQIEFQTTSETSHSGVVKDPQGPSRLAITWDATMRMEVLPADPASASASAPPATAAPNAASPAPAGSIRLRTTYEKSSATVDSDTPDPQAESIEQQYARLEGVSFEITVAPDGTVSALRGLEDVLTDDKARGAAEQWIKQVSGGVGTPANGIIPGQTWTSDEPADSLPLAGLRWHTDSTYLRNESCHPADAPPANATSASTPDLCAVIMTRLALQNVRKLRDPTPPSYRQNGVRTAGTWSSTGESLTYVSLRTGWVVSVTQNGSEQMDMNFTNAQQATVHYAGTVGTHSQVTLLPAAAAAGD